MRGVWRIWFPPLLLEIEGDRGCAGVTRQFGTTSNIDFLRSDVRVGIVEPYGSSLTFYGIFPDGVFRWIGRLTGVAELKLECRAGSGVLLGSPKELAQVRRLLQ